MARSSAGRLITATQTNRLGSKVSKGSPSPVAVPPVIGVHEDAGAALQFGIKPARRLELESAGAGGVRAAWSLPRPRREWHSRPAPPYNAVKYRKFFGVFFAFFRYRSHFLRLACSRHEGLPAGSSAFGTEAMMGCRRFSDASTMFDLAAGEAGWRGAGTPRP